MLVPDAELLFTGEFRRAGPDLVLTGHDGRHHLIPGYFSSEQHPALVAPNGASLSGDVVTLLAGSPTPGEYAQAQPALPPDAIGRVEKVVGDATVIRNGVAVALHVGDAVYKSDVVQTGSGSSVGISFPDGTALNLVANTRMALNEYSYDPDGHSNDALFTLVEGTFAFVAGKVAHTGSMKIDTPVATMGIRGTTGVVEEQIATVTATLGQVSYSFAVVADFGTGVTGQYDLVDANGNVIATISQNGLVTYITPQGPNQQPLVSTQPMSNTQFTFEQDILQQLFQTLNPVNQPTPNNNGGSSTPPPFEIPNIIPQLLQNQGTPIPITVPGGNGNGNTNSSGTVIITPTLPPTGTATPIVFWVGGSVGNWDSANSWSDGVVPTSFSVVEISAAIVFVTDSQTANGLDLGPGAILEIGSGGSLEVNDLIAGPGTVELNASGSDPTLEVNGAVSLDTGVSGSHGTILLTGTPSGDDRIVGVAGSGAVLTNVDFVIKGAGTIGSGDRSLTLINEGKVVATGLLTIDTGNEVHNDGVMAAVDGGTLVIDDALDNAGKVVATHGGAIDFNEVTVTNETDATIEVTHHGVITFDHSQFDCYGNVNVGSGGELLFEYSRAYNFLSESDDGSGGDSSGGTITFDHSYLDNQGQIGGGDNTFNFDFSRVDNEYQLAADDGGTVTFCSSYVDNTGAITVGACSAIYVDNSVIDNTNGTITVSGANSLLELSGSTTINGGTIDLTQETIQSVTEIPGVAGYESFQPAMSGDGQYIVFGAATSIANAMSGNQVVELYHDGEVFQISDLAPAGGSFNGQPSISDSGKYVVFEGDYPVAGESYTQGDIFLYNTQTQALTPVQSDAYDPVLSGNGRFIAMEAPVQGPQYTTEGIVVTNLAGTILTSIGGDPNYSPGEGTDPFGNAGTVNDPALSSSGQYVSFWTTSSEVVVNGTTFDTGNTAGTSQVYVYDRTNNTLQMVSVNNQGQEGIGDSGAITLASDKGNFQSELSANGTYVVFESAATNLVPGAGTGAPNGVSSDVNVSASNVYLYDTQTHTIQLVSAGLDGAAANGASYSPTISADGTYVTFQSTASNLVAGGSGDQAQTYIYDIQTGTISLVSATVDGMPADNESDLGNAVSDNGSVVAFGSLADNLVMSTTNDGDANIYVVDLATAPSGTVDVTGDVTINNAAIEGGEVNVESGAVLALNNATLNGTTLVADACGTINITIDNTTGDTWNTGTVEAFRGGTINISATNDIDLTSSGTIEADGGTINITHNGVSTDIHGTLKATDGGTITVTSINNPSGGGNSGTNDADSGTIIFNGGLGLASAGLAEAINCGTFDVNGGVTNDSGATMEALSGGTFNITVDVTGDDTTGVSNSGTIKADDATLDIIFDVTGSNNNAGIGNTGTIESDSGGTLNISIEISGNSDGIGVNNSAMMVADGGAININVDVSGEDDPTGFRNSGTIKAIDRGTVTFNGGTVNNLSGTIGANGFGAMVMLAAAAILDGTLESSWGGTIQTVTDSGNSTFDGVTIACGSEVQVNDGTSLTLQGTIDNAGTVTLAAGGDPNLIVDGYVTLDGGGAIVLSGCDDNIVSNGFAATLANAGNTISGAGTIGDQYLTLVNESCGTIDANVGGTTLAIDTGCHQIINCGDLDATCGGTLAIDSSLDNYGNVIASDGSHVQIDANVHNDGSIIAQCGGTLTISNSCIVNTYDGNIGVGDGGGCVTIDCSHVDDYGLIGTLSCGTVTIDNSHVDNYVGLVGEDPNLEGIGANSGGSILIAYSDVDNANASSLISAQGDGSSVTFDHSTIDNYGTQVDESDANGILAYDGGTITFDDSCITNNGQIGAFTGSADTAGTMLIENSTVHNASGSIFATGTGNTVQLSDATIIGGTLGGSSGGTIEVVSAPHADMSVLDGSSEPLTITGYVGLGSDTNLALEGTIDVNGANGEIDVGGASLVIEGSVAVNTNVTGGDPEISLISNAATLAAAAPLNTANLDTADISGLTFVPVDVGSFGTYTPVPTGAPDGTEVVNIPPADGQSGYFEITFTLPEGFTNASIAGAANADDVGRVFLNGVALTSSIVSGGSDEVTEYGNATFSSTDQSDFHVGVNTLLVSDANTGGGPSGAAFYADVTYSSANSSTISLDNGQIIGGCDGGTLDNANNTISGAGSIGSGDSSLTLVNDIGGLIDANVYGGTLTIDTGCNAITNAGTLEATNGATLDVLSSVIGIGSETVGDNGILKLESSVAAGQTVTFLDATGTAALADPVAFNGSFAGLVDGDAIDLTNIAPGCISSATIEGSSLVVDLNGDESPLTFNIAGDLAGNQFYALADGGGGTELVLESSDDPPQTDEWINVNGGTWTDEDNAATNWSDGALPRRVDSVLVDQCGSGPYTVTIPSGASAAAYSLTLSSANATILDQGTLALTGLLVICAGTFALDGAIVGGTIVHPGTGIEFNSGTLQGVTYEGALDLTQSNSSVYIADGLTATGADGTGPGTIDVSNNSALNFDDTQTIDNATITLGSGGGGGSVLVDYVTLTAYQANGDQDPTETLTLGAHLTIDQTGGVGDMASGGHGYGTIVNDGTINAEAGSNGQMDIYSTSFVNDGTITVSNGDTLYMGPQSFTNALDGTITVDDGSTLYLGQNDGSWINDGTITIESGASVHVVGGVTPSQLASLTDDGGTVYIDGTLDNSGSTLAVGPGSPFAQVVLNGTIESGTITDAGSGMTFNGGTLQGVTYEGALDVTSFNAAVYIADGLTATGADGTGPGAINVSDNSAIYFDDTQTIDNATITLGSGGGGGSVLVDYVTLTAYQANGDQDPTETLTLGAHLTIDQTGGVGDMASGGHGYGTIVNDGTINAEAGSNGQMDIYSTSFVNDGTITVSNGDALYMSSVETGSGQYTIDGNSTLQFDSSVAAGATVSFAGSLGSYGELVLTDAPQFHSQIDGFTGTGPNAAHSDAIDLTDINYSAPGFEESYNSGTGVLTVTDGTNTANLTFDGFDGTFSFATNGSSGTLVTDPPVTGSAGGASAGSSSTSIGHGMDFGHDQINLAPSNGAINLSAHNGAVNQSASGSITATGHDNFVFHANLAGETALNSKIDHIDLGHANGQPSPQFAAFNAADAHAAAFDPVHTDAILPSGMDQFHQMVASAGHLH